MVVSNNLSLKKQYFKLLCSDRNTDFLNKYLQLPELKRLDVIGQFCGCDYTALYNTVMPCFYSSADHSLANALMTYHFTGDKAQAIAGLYHDRYSPAFRHSNDFRLNDSLNQESSETNKYNVFKPSKQLIDFLKEDGVSIDDILDVSGYPILENEKPRLCTDRLDGIIHTNIFWIPFWSIDKVTLMYNNMTILHNEDGLPELGFKNIEIAEQFSEGIYKYAVTLQTGENKFALQFIGDIINALISNKTITEADLYRLSDQQIVDIIEKSNLKSYWHIFNKATRLKKSNDKPEGAYVSFKPAKKRYVDPLCLIAGETYRLSNVSSVWHNKLENYLAFEDYKYCYLDGIPQDFDKMKRNDFI